MKKFLCKECKDILTPTEELKMCICRKLVVKRKNDKQIFIFGNHNNYKIIVNDKNIQEELFREMK